MPYPAKPDDINVIIRTFATDMQATLELPQGISRDAAQLVLVRAHLRRFERLERWMREYGVKDVARYDLTTLFRLPFQRKEDGPFKEE